MKRLLIAVVAFFPMIGFGQLKKGEPKTDYSELKQTIKEGVAAWLQKGELEKTNEQEARINSRFTQAFDSICFESIKTAIGKKPAIQLALLPYNADVEKFGVRFGLGEISWTDSLFIPLKDAPRFKEGAPDARLSVDGRDWVFTDGWLLPSKVKMVSTQGSFVFPYSKTNAKEIRFTPSDLGVTAPGGKNPSFDYKDYYARAAGQPGLKKNDHNDQLENRVFERVEVEPSVNKTQWRHHLESQLSRYLDDAVSKGMKPGTYTVLVRLVVELDGSVTDVSALNDPGYGLGTGAIAVVKSGPEWTPGEQNGHKVRCYHIQPITFLIMRQ